MKNRKRYSSKVLVKTFLVLVVFLIEENSGVKGSNEKLTYVKDGKSSKLFSPRMDYEQWTPLGRGDPLKNDPTYDYVPPVLERVHYWMDPSRKSDDKKTEILVLGVSSKKPSNQKMETKKDQQPNGVQGDPFHNPNRRTFPLYQFFNKNEYPKHEPLTILVPPPFELGETSYQTQMSSIQTTTDLPTSVSIDSSNLIFQSSSITNEWKGSNTYTTIAEPSSQVTWRTPFNSTNLLGEPSIIVHPQQAPMHKGHVSDDTLDPNNIFVNIGKTETKVQQSDELDLPKETLMPPDKNAPMTFGPSLFMKPTLKQEKPMTLQMTMQTVLPTTEKFRKNFLQNLLKKETTPFLPTTLAPIFTETTTTTTTTPTPMTSTTTVSSLTTDPLFKHYKQPAEPMKGPLYLIIQGHSKVKTYGPSKLMPGINIQETNEILTDDSLTDFPVKHLHKTETKEDWHRKGRNLNLQSLNHVVKTNLGAHSFTDENVKVTELVVKYDVSKDATSEVYKKGIVENEKAPQREHLFLSKFFDKKN